MVCGSSDSGTVSCRRLGAAGLDVPFADCLRFLEAAPEVEEAGARRCSPSVGLALCSTGLAFLGPTADEEEEVDEAGARRCSPGVGLALCSSGLGLSSSVTFLRRSFLFQPAMANSRDGISSVLDMTPEAITQNSVF